MSTDQLAEFEKIVTQMIQIAKSSLESALRRHSAGWDDAAATSLRQAANALNIAADAVDLGREKAKTNDMIEKLQAWGVSH